MLQKYLLGVQYIGTKFSGWPPLNKRSAGFNSVQFKLEDALTRFVGEKNWSSLNVSSRTDAGVHAMRNTFVVNVTRRHRNNGAIMSLTHEPKTVMNALNFYLHDMQVEDIRVLDVTKVDPNFHIRRNVHSRTYEYYVICPMEDGDDANAYDPDCDSYFPSSSSHPFLFHSERAWIVNKSLDVDLMSKTAQKLIGINDFSAFRNSGCQSYTPVKNMYNIKCEAQPLSFISSLNSINNRPPLLIKFTLQSSAFVYRMVRNIVSSLVCVGRGDLTAHEFDDIFHGKDRTVAPPAAPAHGLYLHDVNYNDFNICQ